MMFQLVSRLYSRFFGRTSKELIKVFIIQLLVVFFGFITNIVIARLFGKEELGIFTYFFGLVGLLAIISLFGMQNSIVRIIKKDADVARLLLQKSFLIAIPLMLVITWAALVITDYLGLNPDFPYFKWLVFSYVFFEGIYALLSNSLRGFDRFTLSQLFNLLFRICFFVLVFVGFYLRSFSFVLLSMTLALLVNFPYMLKKFYQYLPKVKKAFSTLVFMRTSYAFFVQSIALYSMLQIDRLSINYVLSFTYLGEYAAYSSVINIIRLAAAVFPIVLTPLAVATKYKIKSSLKKIMFMLVPFALFVYFASWYLVPFLFGTEFVIDYYIPLAMTVSASLLVVYSYLVSIYLGEGDLSKKQLGFVTVDAVLSVFVNLGLNVLMLMKFGLIGAPIATAITIIFKIFVVSIGLKVMREKL